MTIPQSLAATLTVNVLGCLALGFLLYEDIYGDTITQSGRTILATGFISSLTTYSSFSFETVRLWETGDRLRAAIYASGTLGLCLAAAVLAAGVGLLLR